jgi:hypothetical protein
MRHRRPNILSAATLATLLSLAAAFAPARAQAPAAAPAVPVSQLDLRVTDADVQPAVTIKEFDNRTVEEFSVNNNTYMIKVTPAAGAPYYLVDEDGSGEMAWRRGAPADETVVPQWTLFSW